MAFKFDAIIEILKNGGYFSLKLEERMAILDFLYSYVIHLETMHRRFEEIYDNIDNLKREKRTKANALRRELKGETDEMVESSVAKLVNRNRREFKRIYVFY